MSPDAPRPPARDPDAEERAEAALGGGGVDELRDLSVRAVETAAADLGLNPLLFARELAQGEVGLLIAYLRAAAAHVEDVDLRVRIDLLLHRLTEWTADAD